MPRKLAVAMLLAANAFAAWADNRLHIEDFQIASDGEYVVSVLMENDADITSVGADIILPDGMQLVQIYDEYGDPVKFQLNESRVTNHRLPQDDGRNAPKYHVSIVSGSNDAFSGTTGEIFRFKVKASAAMPDKAEIIVSGQEFTRTDYTPVTPADEKATVTKAVQPQGAVLSSTVPSFSINPIIDTHTVEIALANDFDVTAMEAVVTLPEGMSIVGNKARTTLRTRKHDIYCDPVEGTGNSYRFMISSSENSFFRNAEGPVFTFDVTATTALPLNSQIVVSDVELTSSDAVAVKIDGVTVGVTNSNEAALADALAAVAKAVQDSAAAAGTVDPSVKDADKVKAAADGLTASVKALRDKVSDAYREGRLALTPYGDEAKAAADAAAALEKTAAEEKALLDETAVMDALNAALEAAAGAVPADVKDNARVKQAVQAARDAVQALADAVGAAYAAGELAAFDDAALRQAAEDAVAEIGKVAAFEKKVADNNRRKTELAEEIDRLEQALRDQKEAIAGEDPDVAEQFTGQSNDIYNFIDQARTNLDADFRALSLDSTSDLRPRTVKEIEEMIARLRADADAAEQEHAKAARKAASDQRLAELLAELQALQDALDAVVVPAAEDLLPGDKEQLDGRKQAVQDAIDALKDNISAAAADTLLTADSQLPGNTVAGDTEALKAAIADALAAKEAQEAQEKAERKAANDQRLAELLDELKALQDALDAVKVPAKSQLLPGEKKKLDSQKAAIQDAIGALRDGLESAAADTLLTADSQLPDNTVADDTEALKAAIADALAAKEARDKADHKAASDQRQAELLEDIQALQDALDAVVVPAAEDLLPGDKEQLDGRKQAVQDAIDALKDAVNAAAADTLLTADSELPANTVADDTEALKAAIDAARAAKEIQDKAGRKAANDQRLAELLAELQALQDALDAVEVPAADKLLPGAKEPLDNRKAAIQNAIGALTNSVKSLALDTLLTADSQLPDNTVADDTEALKEAIGAAVAAKDAQDKADRKAASDQRLAELLAELQALQDALDAVVVPAAEDLLPGAKEPLDERKQAVQEAIDALKDNINGAAADTLLTADSQLPANTVADDTEALKEAVAAARAAKEAQDKADRKAASDKRLAELLAELQALQDALDAVEVPAADKLLPGAKELLDNRKTAIQNAVDAMRNHVKEQALDTLLTAQSQLPDNTVAADTETLKEAVDAALAAKEAQDKADRKAANDKRLAELTAELQALQDALDAVVVPAAERLLPGVKEQLDGTKQALQEAIDALKGDIDAAAADTLLTAQSQLPGNTVAADTRALKEAVAAALAAKEAKDRADRKDANDRRLAELLAGLQDMQDALDAIEVPAADRLLPGAKEQLDGTKDAIRDAIDALRNSVKAQALDTLLTADSQLPANTVADDTEALKQAVAAAVAAKDAKDKADRKAASDKKQGELLAELQALQNALDAVRVPDEEDLLPGAKQPLDERKQAVQDAIDAMRNGVNAAAADTLLNAASTLPANTVLIDTEALKEAVDAARAAKEAQDKADRKAANDRRLAELLAELQDMQEALDAVVVPAADKLLPGVKEQLDIRKQAVQNAIDALTNNVKTQALDTLLTAQSQLPDNTVADDTEALKEAIGAAMAAKDAKDKADRKAANDKRLAELTAELQALQDALDAVEVPAADKLLPGAKEPLDDRKQAVQEDIDALKDAVNAAAADTLLTAGSQLPANTVADDTEALKQAVAAAVAAKDAKDKADRKAANDKRLAELLAELQDMQDALDAVEVPAADKLLPGAKELLDNRKQAVQNALDAMRNYVKTQALDTLLTAQSQLPDNTVADDTEALKEAVAAARAAKEAQDKADRKAASDKRLAELTAELQALQDALDAVGVPAADKLLPGAKEPLDDRKQAVQEAIDAMKDDIDAAAADTLLTADSQLPANTVAGDTEALKEAIAAALAAKEAQDKADRKAASDQRLAELLAELQALQDALDAVVVPAAEDLLPGVKEPLDNRKAAIQNAIDAMRNHVKEQALDTLLTAQSQLPTNTVAGDTEALKEAVAAAVAAKEAAQAELDAEIAARALARQAVDDAYALTAPAVPADREGIPFYREAAAAADAAQEAVAEARQAADSLAADVEQKAREHAVLPAMDDIREAAGRADSLIAAATEAIGTADSLIAAADRALAEELEAQDAARDILDELDGMAGALTVPEKGSGKHYEQANRLVDAAQEAADAARNAVDSLATLLDAKKDAYAVLADSSELIDAAKAALEAIREAGKAIAAADSALLEARAAEQAAMEVAQAANEAANAMLTDELKALKKKLDSVWAGIRGDYPDVENTLQGARDDIDFDITEERYQLQKMYAEIALADSATVDSLETVYRGISDDIDSLRAKAKRLHDNEAAKRRLDGELAAVQQELQDAVDFVATEYADVAADMEPEAAKVQLSIDSLRERVDSLYGEVALTEDASIDLKPIRDAIEAYLQEAKKRHLIVGIEVVTAEDVTGAQFFTLSGKRVSAPVRGQLMVVRMPDGTTRKVFVR